MSVSVPEAHFIRFADIRPEPFLHVQGEEDEGEVERRVLETPADALVFFDLTGKDYVGYSYAKPTIRKPLSKRNEGVYASRRFFLIGRLDDDFLDGVSRALEEEKLLMYAMEVPDAFGRTGVLVGAKSDALREAFGVLLRTAPASTGELASALNITPQNAKNRIDRLVELGIVVRHKEVSPTGGHEWINRIV